MATNENNLDAYNEVATTLGGAGGDLNDIDAVNAIAILEGAAGGHANMINALNAIDLDAGGAGDHLNTLDALNSIVVLKGGVGGHENDLDAINEWVDVASAFEPDDLPNLEFWLRSDLGVTLFGSNVTDWADQSGNSRDLAQATDAKRPTLETAILNGHDALRFDGVDDFMDRAAVALTPPNTVYIVVRYIVLGTLKFLYDGTNAGNRHLTFIDGAPIRWQMFAGLAVAGSNADTLSHYFTTIFNGASSELFLDGVSDATGNTGADAWNFCTLGSHENEIQNFGNFDLFEFFGYSGVHDAATRTQVWDYLTARYAL